MTIGSVIVLFVWLVAICVLAWLAYWVISQFGPPEPVGRIARVAIVVVAVILLIVVLVQFTGGGISMNTQIGG